MAGPHHAVANYHLGIGHWQRPREECRHILTLRSDLPRCSAVMSHVALQAFLLKPQEECHRFHRNSALPEGFPSATVR